ncbi:MAG: hypothetical protein NUV75_14035 [Gallionella sp.]|nr:hypothetical protein [Gallionella sp.]
MATTLCAGLGLGRGQKLTQQLGVPVLTILRWRQWWLTDFPMTKVWRNVAGRFLPPVTTSDLPGELLKRVVADDVRSAMVMIMRWLAPLSTLTEAR